MLKKLRIAITGGIGSGKSEVSKIIAEAGYPVLYADQIAKDLLVSNKDVRRELISIFGPESYIGDSPDKKYLAEKIFSNPDNVQKINSIIHPETLKIITSWCDELLKQSHLVFVESALIYEANREELFDFILLVFSDRDIRIVRASEALGITKSQVEERMKHQIDDDIKKSKADFIIKNNSDLNELKRNSEFILNLIEITAGIK